MLQRILLPLDGSTLAESALPHALALAETAGGTLILAHVLEQTHQPGQRGPVDPVGWHLRKAEAHSYLESVLNQVIQAGGRGEVVVLEGTAADRIITYAQEQNIELVVLSSHGQSGLSDWNISSVVQKILLRAYTSVFLVRAYRPNPVDAHDLRYGRILVPLDGSQRAENVFPMLNTLLQREGTALLVHVVTQPEMLRRVPLTAEERQLAERLVTRNYEEATRYLAQVKAYLGGNVETRVLVGESVIATLHDVAEREAVDLVLLSAHGYTASPNHPYGSVGTSFIAYGNTPLLIVQDMNAPSQSRVREFVAQNDSEPRGRVALYDPSPN